MGCNFHGVVQVDDAFVENRVVVDKFVTIAEVDLDRDYALYAALAGVRNRPVWGITPVAEPRGLPDGSAYSYPFDTAMYEFHHQSWLTADEFAEAMKRATTENHSAIALLAYMRAFEGLGRKVRLVFCFDN